MTRQWLAPLVLGACMWLMRATWQAHPTVENCSAFWLLAVLFNLSAFVVRPSTSYARRLGWLPVLGALCNAAVTMANGGRMPVLNDTVPLDGASVWVAATDEHALLWLCDRFWGSSLGDFLLFSWLPACLLVCVWQAWQRRRADRQLVLEVA